MPRTSNAALEKVLAVVEKAAKNGVTSVDVAKHVRPPIAERTARRYLARLYDEHKVGRVGVYDIETLAGLRVRKVAPVFRFRYYPATTAKVARRKPR
jgi:hypothetical protein